MSIGQTPYYQPVRASQISVSQQSLAQGGAVEKPEIGKDNSHSILDHLGIKKTTNKQGGVENARSFNLRDIKDATRREFAFKNKVWYAPRWMRTGYQEIDRPINKIFGTVDFGVNYTNNLAKSVAKGLGVGLATGVLWATMWFGFLTRWNYAKSNGIAGAAIAVIGFTAATMTTTILEFKRQMKKYANMMKNF